MGHKEQVEGFTFNQDAKGLSAQRVYFYSTEQAEWSDEIPQIGDSFPATFEIGDNLQQTSNLICVKREVSFVASDVRVTKWICTYSNEPSDLAQYTANDNAPPSDTDNLPVNIDYSAEYVLYNPPQDATGLASSKWVWNDDQTTKILEPIPFAVRQATKKIQGVVLDADYQAMINTVQSKIGQVNSAGDYFKEKGCWLFAGLATEMYRNFVDKKAWKAELTFIYRDPDGTKTDGWQKILSRDGGGVWKIPYNTSTTKMMYTETDLDSLIK